MSKFAGYSEDQKSRMKAFGCMLVEAKVLAGATPCTDTGIRAVMPAAMEAARLTVVTLDDELGASRFDDYVENARNRIRAVATKLVEGQLRSGAITDAEDAIKAGVKQAVEDARRTVIAVDEFLCG
ncbi:hypothetical protein AB4Y45_35280 [Paraburkholderia sp. EG287A]|uniref:hypothetical protein n=1 Tax=Paraburkholderia sp. EG287A TaxID=3237012 RepID=UPI0034D36399